MQIFVDADACPVVDIIEEIAEKYNISNTLLCDTFKQLFLNIGNHFLEDISVIICLNIFYKT